MLHPLLKRQLKRSGIDPEDPAKDPAALRALLDRVHKYYEQVDESRYRLERSLTISSAEMQELNGKLRAREASLQAEHDRLRAILSSLGDGLCVLDERGHCLILNPEGERLLGWTQADAAGAPFLERISDLELPDCEIGEGVRADDAEFRRRDGTRLPVAFALTPILHDGSLGGAVLVFTDIRERKLVLQALEREHEQLRTIIANTPIAIAMFDREMRYVAHSTAWLRDHGLQGRTLVGSSHYELFPDTTRYWRELHARAMAGEVLSRKEDQLEDHDGRQRHVRWAIQPWRTPEGEIGGIVMVTESIDDLVEARELALEAARVKAQFLANMSHEIRTPLNGVIGMCELLMQSELNTSQHDCAETILGSASSLMMIVNDLLDFSKIEAGKLRMERIEFDPRAVINEVVGLLAVQARRKGLEITTRIDAEVPARLLGDPLRLKQVLINLAGNAVKFTQQGGVTLSVSAEHQAAGQARLTFEVQDTGIGIDSELQAGLFEPFSQADGSITRRFGGTGLGLTISKQLVTLMGGTIDVESEPGRGSRFHFNVAFSWIGEPAAREPQPVRELEGARVLIVGDDSIQRSILEMQVRAWGAEIALAGDGREALVSLRHAAAAARPHHAAVIDLGLPDVDPRLLAEEIRADAALESTRLIVLLTSTVRAAEAQAAGDSTIACLAKPVSGSQLKRFLSSMLASRFGPEPAPALPTRGRKPSSTPSRTESRPCVLLVEDNAVNRKVATRMLETLGCRVAIALDGREALAAAASARYDLVLMDCQMPVLDGLETTRILREREQPGEPRLPIVAMTANAMGGDRESCLAAGMDGYLSKPVRLETLQRVLERWLVRV